MQDHVMVDEPDASLFQLVSSQALQSLLDRIVGPKTLVLSSSLAGPLGLITEVGLLKNNHGVTKMFWLEPGALTQAERNIVYLCRPELKWMRIIADQIKSAPSQSSHLYHMLVVPRMSAVCTQALSDLGVLGSIDIQEFQLGLIPLEKDLLSLEYDDVYRKLALDGDYGPIYDMGKALMTVQRAFGVIPRIIGKGEAAKRLCDLLERLCTELPYNAPSASPLAPGFVDSMIVLDRRVDVITPLCTQLTYEGLVDEVAGIRNSHFDVDPNLLNPTPTASTSTPSASTFGAAAKKKKHLLSSSSDPLFSLLRDKNFAVVGGILNRTARRLNDDYERRHQAKTPAELRQFVGQLGGLQSEHQSLRLHTGLTEQIMNVTSTDEFNSALEIQQNLVAGVELAKQEEAMRDLINQEIPIKTVLRLLCLYSVITGGLKPKVFEEFKRDLLQTYGFEYVPLLLHLESLNLLYKTSSTSSSSSSKSPFALSRKPLRLIVDDVDEHDPRDISYVFSGYAPLSVRLVQCALGKDMSTLNGWRGIEDVLKGFEGPSFDVAVPTPATIGRNSNGPGSGTNDSATGTGTGTRTTIVCYLGGITYAEISALRFLNRQTRGRNLLIVTTGCVQGSTLLTSLMPDALREQGQGFGHAHAGIGAGGA